MVLILRIFAVERNCGLFPRLKEDIESGSTGLIGPLKSVCLVSGNDKAGGKQCTM